MKKLVNPILKMDYPDPDVIRVGDTYYMVSTTMYFMPGCVILRSYDLAEWEIVGYVYDKLDDTPAERMEFEKNEYSGGMWAPSIRYHENEFIISFRSNSGDKNYIFRSDKIEGPWKKNVLQGAFHDSSLLFDDDGRKYIVYGNTEIRITELNDELTAPKPGGLNRILFRDETKHILGYEGSHIYKIGEYYYVFVINWPEGGVRTESCFRSKSLTGEFEGGVVLSSGTDYSPTGVAQGGIVDTLGGKWFAVLFQDMGAVGRIPVLVPVTWKDDFPVFGEEGKAPERLEIVSSRPGYPYEPLYTSDRFLPKEGLPKERQLSPQWQWNHQPDNNLWRLLPEGGLEVKTDKIAINLTHAKNTLTQRMLWPCCGAEVTIDASSLKDGDVAGLCALQYCYGLVGVMKELGNYYLVRIVRNTEKDKDNMARVDFMPGYLTDKIRLDGPEVTVYLKANFEDMKDRLDFYYFKKDKFVKVGAHHKMEFRLSHFTGNRFGLCVYSTKRPGGKAIFKNFIYSN
ncbi:MAG: family 43 glycosylhydrolase [Lachnospiraceae bacterium]|nr:family 43 glycosylhydrolase [Lachnospiraceae bacterium]